MSFGPAWMAPYRRALPAAQTTSRKTAEPVIGNLPLRQSAAARSFIPGYGSPQGVNLGDVTVGRKDSSYYLFGTGRTRRPPANACCLLSDSFPRVYFRQSHAKM